MNHLYLQIPIVCWVHPHVLTAQVDDHRRRGGPSKKERAEALLSAGWGRHHQGGAELQLNHQLIYDIDIYS